MITFIKLHTPSFNLNIFVMIEWTLIGKNLVLKGTFYTLPYLYLCSFLRFLSILFQKLKNSFDSNFYTTHWFFEILNPLWVHFHIVIQIILCATISVCYRFIFLFFDTALPETTIAALQLLRFLQLPFIVLKLRKSNRLRPGTTLNYVNKCSHFDSELLTQSVFVVN